MPSVASPIPSVEIARRPPGQAKVGRRYLIPLTRPVDTTGRAVIESPL